MLLRNIFISKFREVCRSQLHGTQCRIKRSATSSSIQHFQNEQKLNFVISSIREKTHDDEKKSALPKIYSPALSISPEKLNTMRIDDDSATHNIQHFHKIIESHYTLEDRSQFVGGMGENDGGVWFMNRDLDDIDTLDYYEEIRGMI